MNRSPAMAFLFVTVFVDMLGYGLVVPLLPFYADGLANGALLIGALGSLYAAMQFFGGPFFLAGLSDRTGRRPVLVACLLGASLAYALLGIAETFTLVVAAVALAGAAGGTQATAQAFVADSTPPEDRARGLGLIGAAFGLGLMAGPLLGGLLSLHSLAASALALLNAAFGLFALTESLPEDRRSRTPLLRLDPVSGLVRTIRMEGTGPLLLAVLLLNLAFAGLLTNFPLFFGARFGWGASENAFFFAFVGACAVATQGLLVGRIQRLFGEVGLALGGLALAALCLAVVGGSASGWMLYPVVGALAVGAGLAIPALTTLLSRRAPAEEQGKLMGGVQAVLSLALISGPLVAGAAFDELGVSAPYFIGATLAALALPAVALSGRKKLVTLGPGPGVAVPGPEAPARTRGRKETIVTTVTPSSPKLSIGIIVLTVVTAAVHLYLGFQGLPLFVLNGLGYLALLAALYLPVPRLLPYRNAVRWVLVGYTALTIVLWLVITGGIGATIGYMDKVVEVLLIIMLLAEARANR